MVSFEHLILEEGVPIYIQLITHVKHGLIAGVIADQEEMPSRRVLSSLLGVNPNTVQKAYRLLEDEGIIESRSGAKSYVTLTDGLVAQIRAQLLESDAAVFVRSMRQMGLQLEDALQLVRQVWQSEEDPL